MLRTVALVAAIGGLAVLGAVELMAGQLTTGVAGLLLAAANLLLLA